MFISPGDRAGRRVGGNYSDRQLLNGLSIKTFVVPPGYANLRFIITGATLTAALQDNPLIRVNGLSTAIYSVQRHYNFGTTVSADSSVGATSWSGALAGLPGATARTNESGFVELEIFDYSNADSYKVGQFRGRQPFNNTTGASYHMIGALEVDTIQPITSISVTPTSGALFRNGSVAHLILIPG